MKSDIIVRKYIENLVLPSEPLRPMWNRENFIFKKQVKWNYIDNCMIKAILRLSETEHDSQLEEYAVRFTDAYVSENGNIPTMKPEDFNLDNINGGKNLIYLYNKTHKEKYRLAYEKIFENLGNQPRLECGNFWHKAIYPYQLWLDGIYMSLPFMAEYYLIHGDNNIITDIRNQLENIYNIMRDPETGLYYHGYDETRSMNWANPETGLSPQFWLRAIGWLCAGLADICGLLPELEISHIMLLNLLESLMKYLTPENMLLQLPACPELERNYPETSGTLLFAYSAAKAYNLGIADINIKNAGISAFDTVTEKYIINEHIPLLKNICLMGGLGGENRRDGSAEYYLSERIVVNDAKGIAPYLMAYAEINS